MQLMFFYLFGALAVICSVVMIMSRRAVTSALNLVVVMFCLAALFAIMEAHLIAALQILVYAGAIMVLFVFVIMLLNLREKSGLRSASQMLQQLAGIIILGALFVPLVMTFDMSAVPGVVERTAQFGTTQGVGGLLYTQYLLPFEIASVLLLAALVGAVALGKTRLR